MRTYESSIASIGLRCAFARCPWRRPSCGGTATQSWASAAAAAASPSRSRSSRFVLLRTPRARGRRKSGLAAGLQHLILSAGSEISFTRLTRDCRCTCVWCRRWRSCAWQGGRRRWRRGQRGGWQWVTARTRGAAACRWGGRWSCSCGSGGKPGASRSLPPAPQPRRRHPPPRPAWLTASSN